MFPSHLAISDAHHKPQQLTIRSSSAGIGACHAVTLRRHAQRIRRVASVRRPARGR